jgi:ABC-type nickel/cobalt efflux system permease component RcnA
MMPDLVPWLASNGGAQGMALLVALLLGLRHATDPDHLTAVSTLVLSDQRRGTRRANLLGFAWGLGHATTLFAFGLPVILFGRHLPPPLQRAAEAAIGVVIIALAARLLLRWSRGAFHTHAHTHEGIAHAHPHAHERRHPGDAPHAHRHAETLGRSPLAAFGVGLLHGVGGSAAVGILLVSAVSGKTGGVLALLLFAATTAISMAAVSAALGYLLTRGATANQVVRWIPVFSIAGILFGVWYAFGALSLH